MSEYTNDSLKLNWFVEFIDVNLLLDTNSTNKIEIDIGWNDESNDCLY